jgi:hypothetical protein
VYVKNIRKLIPELTQGAELVYIIRHGTKMMVKYDQ